jgi:hypothetical protein
MHERKQHHAAERAMAVASAGLYEACIRFSSNLRRPLSDEVHRPPCFAIWEGARLQQCSGQVSVVVCEQDSCKVPMQQFDAVQAGATATAAQQLLCQALPPSTVQPAA